MIFHRCLAASAIALITTAAQAEPARFTIATFSADVTIPVGHPCMGGGIAPARSVAERLMAKGLVLTGAEKPLVLVAFDWCEIRGSAFDDWRSALAEEAGTEPQRVLIASTHAHDAPVMDPEAEFLLRDTERSGAWKTLPAPDPKSPIQLASVCWPDFNRLCIQRVRAALREAHARPITHFGIGRAEVREVASNRRYRTPEGAVRYKRMSRSTAPVAQAADAGTIDPWLRTLSFWDGDTALCALHSYAIHPMSFYGAGEVSIDFVGHAREQRQREQPDVFQISASGCAGNVTAGKWNTGDPTNRPVLVKKLRDAIAAAWNATQKFSLERIRFASKKIPLGARDTPGFTEEALRNRLRDDPLPFARAEAAMGLAWYARVKSGHRVDLPMLDFGPAQLLLLPAESYVEYQLFAQEQRPASFVVTLGYGECGPGYIPIERAWQERDTNLRDWTWVPPGSEAVMKDAIRAVLSANAP